MDKLNVKDQRIVFMADRDERLMLEELQGMMARNMSDVLRYALTSLYEKVSLMPKPEAVMLGRE